MVDSTDRESQRQDAAQNMQSRDDWTKRGSPERSDVEEQ